MGCGQFLDSSYPSALALAASRESATSSRSESNKSEYTSSVIAADLCPSIRLPHKNVVFTCPSEALTMSRAAAFTGASGNAPARVCGGSRAGAINTLTAVSRLFAQLAPRKCRLRYFTL